MCVVRASARIDRVHHHKHRPIREHTHPVSIFSQFRRLAIFPVLVLLAFLVVSKGVTTLAGGRLGYYNFQHLTVFAPYAIVVGMVVLWVLPALWKKAKIAGWLRKT
jgi:hypothetical protein